MSFSGEEFYIHNLRFECIYFNNRPSCRICCAARDVEHSLAVTHFRHVPSASLPPDLSLSVNSHGRYCCYHCTLSSVDRFPFRSHIGLFLKPLHRPLHTFQPFSLSGQPPSLPPSHTFNCIRGTSLRIAPVMSMTSFPRHKDPRALYRPTTHHSSPPLASLPHHHHAP